MQNDEDWRSWMPPPKSARVLEGDELKAHEYLMANSEEYRLMDAIENLAREIQHESYYNYKEITQEQKDQMNELVQKLITAKD